MKSIKILTVLFIVSLFGTSFQLSAPRRLLLFGKDQAAFQTQLQWLGEDTVGLIERDVKIEKIDYKNPLSRKHNIKTGQLTVLLIGRDGGEKFRIHSPVTTKELFDIIDSMPMRQLEMKKN